MKNTEDKILEATLNLVGKEGFDKATTRKIAEEAGVCELTLFRKFKNKENLVREAYRKSIKKSINDIDNVFIQNGKKDFENNLFSLYTRLYEGIDERSNQLVVQIRRIITNQNMLLNQDPKNSYLESMRNKLAQYFQDQIKNGTMREVNPNAAALMFFSLITFEKIIMKTVHNEPSKIPQEDFLDIFLNGISK